MADYRFCGICGTEYNALLDGQSLGHKCRLEELQRAALLAYDSGQMEEYESLNRMIAAKITGSHTSPKKARSSADNGRLGGRPRKTKE